MFTASAPHDPYLSTCIATATFSDTSFSCHNAPATTHTMPSKHDATTTPMYTHRSRCISREAASCDRVKEGHCPMSSRHICCGETFTDLRVCAGHGTHVRCGERTYTVTLPVTVEWCAGLACRWVSVLRGRSGWGGGGGGGTQHLVRIVEASSRLHALPAAVTDREAWSVTTCKARARGELSDNAFVGESVLDELTATEPADSAITESRKDCIFSDKANMDALGSSL